MPLTPHAARPLAAATFGLLLLAAPAAAQLPAELDGDRDGFADNLETALGADPGSRESTPESFALADTDGDGVADACADGTDNDRDGKIDGDDPGCAEPLPEVALSAGLDVFRSRASFDAGALGKGLPPQKTELSGPAVVRRGVPRDGAVAVEMVAFQLGSPSGPVTLVENPKQRSGGEVRANDDETTWRGRFDIQSLVVVGGRVVAEDRREVVNPALDTLPPVEQDTPGEIDCTGPGCYRFTGGCHCPRTPELRIPVKVYTAKFDCGQQPSTPPPFLGPVTPGLYATKIVVHNPADKTVEARKKVSVGERNPRTGKVTPLEAFKLRANRTTEVDCPDIWRLLGFQPPSGQPAPFLNCVVEVISRDELDVIANYTQEVPKEKIEFRVWPCCEHDGPLAKIAGRRLKAVTLVTEDVLIDEEHEARAALLAAFPEAKDAIARAHVEIVGDELGVGSSLDVEPVGKRDCLLVGPRNDPRVDCSRKE